MGSEGCELDENRGSERCRESNAALPPADSWISFRIVIINCKIDANTCSLISLLGD